MHAPRTRCRRSALQVLALVAGVLIALLPALPSRAEERAAAIVYDVIAGDVLYEDAPDARRYPASLTKVMTIYIAFEELAAGRIKLDDQISMSAWASSRPPSKLGIKPGGTIKVRDAIKALVTKSANDVATALGEAIGGSEADFAVRMTTTAARLGMKSTVFKNASGLPHPGQYTTARDLALLGVAIQRDFPQYYGVFQTRVFTFGKRQIGNHNRLLAVKGVDGIKTGYVNASGFNLITSIRRDGKHLVAVVMGGASGGKRDARMRRLLEAALPKAQSGDPMLIADWNDTVILPIPGRRPSMATRFAANVNKGDGGDPITSTVLAFAAETRAALGTEQLVVDRRTTSDALQAVIAQADPGAAIVNPAPAPLPATPAAIVAARQDARTLIATAAEAEGTDLGEVIEEVVFDTAAEAVIGDPFTVAFDRFDATRDPVLSIAIANLGAPPVASSTISRGGVVVYQHRIRAIPAGRTTPIRQKLTLNQDTAQARAPEPALAFASPPPGPATTTTTRAKSVEVALTRRPAAAPTRPLRAKRDVAAPRPRATEALTLVEASTTLAEAAAELAAGGRAAPPARWQIQVGAVPSREAATDLLEELTALEPAIGKRARVTLPVAAGGGTVYRARFSGFGSERDARAACTLFANHNRPCWAVSM